MCDCLRAENDRLISSDKLQGQTPLHSQTPTFQSHSSLQETNLRPHQCPCTLCLLLLSDHSVWYCHSQPIFWPLSYFSLLRYSIHLEVRVLQKIPKTGQSLHSATDELTKGSGRNSIGEDEHVACSERVSHPTSGHLLN